MLKRVVFLLDARHGIKLTDIQYLNRLQNYLYSKVMMDSSSRGNGDGGGGGAVGSSNRDIKTSAKKTTSQLLFSDERSDESLLLLLQPSSLLINSTEAAAAATVGAEVVKHDTGEEGGVMTTGEGIFPHAIDYNVAAMDMESLALEEEKEEEEEDDVNALWIEPDVTPLELDFKTVKKLSKSLGWKLQVVLTKCDLVERNDLCRRIRQGTKPQLSLSCGVM